MSNVPPHKRDVNTVFQQYALFPHMTVWDNVAFGPRSQEGPGKDESPRGSTSCSTSCASATSPSASPPSSPAASSSGSPWPARSSTIPSALLLDEPLGALDLKLRQAMQIELKRIQREVGITFIFVTHDQEEALTMSDRIAVMNEGRVEQIGTPEEIYDHPPSVFVAGFIGQANLWPRPSSSTDGSDRADVRLGDRSIAGAARRHSPRARRARARSWSGRSACASTSHAADATGASVPCTVTDYVFQGPVVRFALQPPTAPRSSRTSAPTSSSRCCARATTCGRAGIATACRAARRRPARSRPPASHDDNGPATRQESP